MQGLFLNLPASQAVKRDRNYLRREGSQDPDDIRIVLFFPQSWVVLVLVCRALGEELGEQCMNTMPGLDECSKPPFDEVHQSEQREACKNDVAQPHVMRWWVRDVLCCVAHTGLVTDRIRLRLQLSQSILTTD